MSPTRRQLTTTIRFVALAVVGLVALTGCSITPLEEVNRTPIATPQVPDALALVNDSREPVANRSRVANSGPRVPDALLVDTASSGAWIVDTDDARLGVHSSPGHLFTLLGVLGPGDGVISTGRSVATAGVPWMEIRWHESTAWIINAGLAAAE